MADLKEKPVDKASGLAPWRSDLPWWIILIEGIVIGIMGLMLVLNPDKSSINVAIGFTVVLVVIGVIQLWAVIRNKVPERLDGFVSARGAIAIFAGLSILLLLYADMLT